MKSLNTHRSRPNSLWDFMSELENAFDTSWNQRGENGPAREIINFNPNVDVVEGSDHYLVSVDLPGMNEKDIKIDVHSGNLTISGERSHEYKKENGDRHVYERSFGKFRRTFTLPKEVNSDGIQARFENGVLEVFIPKAEKAKPKSVSIEASKGGLFSRILGEKNSSPTDEKTEAAKH